MNIDLHVKKLVLDHCPSGERERVIAAVRRELERLVTESGLSTSLLKRTEIPRIDGGSLEIGRRATAELGLPDYRHGL